MHNRVIGFYPPVLGTEEEFNTFRLGGFYTKHLSPGEEVFLLNEKEKLIFGRARVQRIETGKLAEMIQAHAADNHAVLDGERELAPDRLMAILTKFYGPHIATPTKKTTVVYMRRIE